VADARRRPAADADRGAAATVCLRHVNARDRRAVRGHRRVSCRAVHRGGAGRLLMRVGPYAPARAQVRRAFFPAARACH
jgi:hypothetical protein